MESDLPLEIAERKMPACMCERKKLSAHVRWFSACARMTLLSLESHARQKEKTT